MITDITLDSDEQLVLRVHRTIIWLIPLYLLAIAILAGVLYGVFWIARNQGQVSAYMPVPLALMIVLAGGALLSFLNYVFIKVYQGNRMVITNERVVLLTQRSLFHQSVPQLNLADVQEVTVHQNGLLSHLFGYGTIIVETAGEQKNIELRFATNPHEAVRQIEEAAEVYKHQSSSPTNVQPGPVLPA